MEKVETLDFNEKIKKKRKEKKPVKLFLNFML